MACMDDAVANLQYCVNDVIELDEILMYHLLKKAYFAVHQKIFIA